MTPDRDAVREAFAGAVDAPPGERAAWLAAHVADEAVRAEAAALLEHHEACDAPVDRGGEPGDGAEPVPAPSRRPALLSALVVAALLAVWWAADALGDLERDVHHDVAAELGRVRDEVRDALRDVSIARFERVRLAARDERVVAAVAALRDVERAGSRDLAKRLLASPSQSQVRAALEASGAPNDASGLLVLSADGTWIAASASAEHRIGSRPPAAHAAELFDAPAGRLAPDLVARVLQRELPLLGVAAPIRVDGRPEAVLVTFHALDGVVEPLLAGGDLDVFLFDRGGRFLTVPRHGDVLAERLYPDACVDAWLTPVVVAPPVDAGRRATDRPFDTQPTALVERALAGASRGVVLDAYRGYHGEDVVGAWSSLDDEGIGIAVERAPPPPLGTHAARIATVLAVAATCGAFVVVLRPRRRRDRGDATLGPYRLEALVGSGHAADVYRARHARLDRLAAVKVLRRGVLSRPSDARFRREVRLASRLHHPNTVEIRDVGRTVDGVSYCAMEYVDGATLEEILRATGPLPAARVVHVLRGVCASLEEAHAVGLLHRDVKPANVMLARGRARRDVVKVLDFALPMVSDSVVAGTPPYIAPERLDGAREDERSDVYSVGALAFVLLTGRPLHDGAFGDVLRATLDGTPRAPSAIASGPVPAALDELVLRCVSREPLDRPWSMRRLREELDALDVPVWTRADADAWWAASEAALGEVAPARAGRVVA